MCMQSEIDLVCQRAILLRDWSACTSVLLVVIYVYCANIMSISYYHFST